MGLLLLPIKPMDQGEKDTFKKQHPHTYTHTHRLSLFRGFLRKARQAIFTVPFSFDTNPLGDCCVLAPADLGPAGRR